MEIIIKEEKTYTLIIGTKEFVLSETELSEMRDEINKFFEPIY